MKKGLSSNIIKIIAITTMIIDHIGLYLYRNFSDNTYFLLRTIGRMAMPIFTYLIIQGYFYTKNIKKYILRIFELALFTQLILSILGFINQEYYPKYWTNVNHYLGILFSYGLSLLLITIIDRKIIISRLNEKQNLFVRINIFILILYAYLRFKIEFDMRIPFLFLELYAIEKLFENDEKVLIKKNKKSKLISRITYLGLIFFAFAISLLFVTYTPGNKYAMLGAIIPIALYNGERGKNNNIIKFIFYILFPIQHSVLYLIAMCQTGRAFLTHINFLCQKSPPRLTHKKTY